MERTFASSFIALAALFALLISIKPVRAADWVQSYCSPDNTARDNTLYTWQWQSNGNCTNHCKQVGNNFAFAVLQYTDCWCSNYIPGDQTDVSNCQVDCPGFPDEKCGSKKDNLFMYIQMDGKPSGTMGGSQPSSTAAAPTSQTQAATSQAPTSQQQPSTTPTPKSSPTHTDQPVTMPTLVTESGVVVTRTVVITPTSAASETSHPEPKSNVAAIAGGVAGGFVALIAIVGGILFLLWRKRRRQQDQENGSGDSSGITRNVSTMSRAGLLGGRTEKTPTPIVTKFGSQRSRNESETGTPITPSSRRLSQPILVDSRLNPAAVLTFHGANLSRESLGSIDDSRDYGRQLNVRNPDPFP
ncbi:ER membrane Wsc4 [Pyrenophora seminiperda CCB06]|uniref:ER membrane Wsc4 n=1 Tax=Pyrenophora seminiperda CCB06 TaxID=1302712 RepID=A0A3M7M0L3_9PLEO|nr:ER membrane Wsc4 [Pyrenophora seminiperda CCB06]